MAPAGLPKQLKLDLLTLADDIKRSWSILSLGNAHALTLFKQQETEEQFYSATN